jgi:hypothetical protein
VAIKLVYMYTYHLNNILESNGDNNAVVIAHMKAWGCTFTKSKDRRLNGLVRGWRERIIPPHAPRDYLKLIDRLDDGFEYEYAGETFRPTSRVQRSGRIYTAMSSGKRVICFQAQPSKERALFTWKGEELEGIDVSASQLRIACALRGEFLPFSASPWDSLAVKHPVNEVLTHDLARELKKTVGLLLVRGERRVDYKKAWLEKIKAPEEVMPRMAGYKGAVEAALLRDFPILGKAVPIIKSTPDGYTITHRSKKPIGKHHIHSTPLGIKTSYHRYASEPPTEGNMLEAMEAYVLRNVILALPVESPILTCHDQVYVLKSDRSNVGKAFELELRKIARKYAA